MTHVFCKPFFPAKVHMHIHHKPPQWRSFGSPFESLRCCCTRGTQSFPSSARVLMDAISAVMTASEALVSNLFAEMVSSDRSIVFRI